MCIRSGKNEAADSLKESVVPYGADANKKLPVAVEARCIDTHVRYLLPVDCSIPDFRLGYLLSDLSPARWLVFR